MLNLFLAWRNVRRNRRRSAITLMTVAVGATALLLLGALMSYVVLQLQTSTVRRLGHLAVFKTGYFQYGTGNPAAYGIPGYQSVLDLIRNDADIKPYLVVATPTQVVAGVAGNYKANTSKTFFGEGVVPADRLIMRDWNAYGLDGMAITSPPLQRADGVALGSGMLRILRLCERADTPADTAACLKGDPAVATTTEATASRFDSLREADAPAAAPAARGAPTIDLLAATTGGAPNVVSAAVERSDVLGQKEFNDNFVLMQLPLSQQLVYGRDEPRATAIYLQLHSTDDIAKVRAALTRLLKDRKLDLEVRDFTELDSMYLQTQSFFSFLFKFISAVIVMIVVFTIMNTMGMSVMERVGEIGTARSLGVQRSGIRSLFVTEGALQGLIGATLGVVLAMLVVHGVNLSDLRWSPPSTAGTIPFKLILFGRPEMLGGVWLLLTAVAAIASLVPAHRASRMQIVDALRHV